MAIKFLDLTGLQKFWTKCKNAFVAKSGPATLTDVLADNLTIGDGGKVTLTNGLHTPQIFAGDDGSVYVGADLKVRETKGLGIVDAHNNTYYIRLDDDGELTFDGDKLALASDVPEIQSLVTVSGDETIAGEKTFTEKVNVTGSLTINNAAVATESYVASAVANAGHLKREVVDALPGVATGKENVIYMVSNSTTGDNKFDEYMLINGAFEKTGSSDVDLSGYPNTAITETEINALT